MSRKPFESPAGLSAGSFARLEVCLLAMMHRLSDDQVLELADTLHSVIRARRRGAALCAAEVDAAHAGRKGRRPVAGGVS